MNLWHLVAPETNRYFWLTVAMIFTPGLIMSFGWFMSAAGTHTIVAWLIMYVYALVSIVTMTVFFVGFHLLVKEKENVG